MEGFWWPALAGRFGSHNIINVLESTALQSYATQFGFGLFVIRGAVDPDQTEQFEDGMNTMFDELSLAYGSNSGKFKGKRSKKTFYTTVQATTEQDCICECMYPGTRKFPLIKLPDSMCKMLSDSEAWLHDGVANNKFRFNEIQATRYDSTNQESIPWHSDQHGRLGKETVILSITTHSPGAFCFQPRQGSKFSYEFHGRHTKYEARTRAYAAAGVRGVLSLHPGDIMVMTGTAQEHLEHKTIANHEITREKLEKYPAVNENVRRYLDAMLIAVERSLPRYRGVVTFRKTRCHNLGLRLARKCLREEAYRDARTHIATALCLARKVYGERSGVQA